MTLLSEGKNDPREGTKRDVESFVEFIVCT